MGWAKAFLILSLAMASGWRGAAQHVSAAKGDQATRTDEASVATAVVGPTGGAVALSGGAKVVVPAGVLQVPTLISIREVPLPPTVRIPPGTVRVSKFYSIEPRLAVSQPVAVTLPYDPTLLPPGFEEGSVSIYQLRANGRLSMVGSVTGDPTSESSGQDLDIVNNLVTVRVLSTATYTLLAIED
jgi:hypothetical protein